MKWVENIINKSGSSIEIVVSDKKQEKKTREILHKLGYKWNSGQSLLILSYSGEGAWRYMSNKFELRGGRVYYGEFNHIESAIYSEGSYF